MTAANSSHETTGNAKNRTIREWSTGRIQRLRVSGELRLEEERDRAGEQEQRRRDEGEDQVLDHVDAEQRRVVALDPRVEGDEQGDDPEGPGHGPVTGDRVGPGGAAGPGRPRSRHRSSAPIAGSQTSGSNDHDRRNEPASGAGGTPPPWADATGAARSVATTPAPSATVGRRRFGFTSALSPDSARPGRRHAGMRRWPNRPRTPTRLGYDARVRRPSPGERASRTTSPLC